ncbi:MAG: hypothetical protein ACMV1D_03520 [Macromonas sp.]
MAKPLTADKLQLCVSTCYRAGWLVPGTTTPMEWRHHGRVVGVAALRAADGVLHVSRRWNGADVVESVELETTAAHFGGTRQWFTCPCCGRRCGVLYLGKRLACRTCYGLAYRVERETAHDKALRRCERIRDRLGWRAGIAYGIGPKPGKMRHATFERILAEYDKHLRRVLALVPQRFS